MKLKYLKSSKLMHYLIVGILCLTFGTVAAQAAETEKVGFCGTVVKLPPLKSTSDCEAVRNCHLDPVWDPSETAQIKLQITFADGYQDGRLAFDAEAAYLDPVWDPSETAQPITFADVYQDGRFSNRFWDDFDHTNVFHANMIGEAEFTPKYLPTSSDPRPPMPPRKRCFLINNEIVCVIEDFPKCDPRDPTCPTGPFKLIKTSPLDSFGFPDMEGIDFKQKDRLRYESRLQKDFNHSIFYQSSMIDKVALASDSLQTINDWSGVRKDFKTSKLYSLISADMDGINPKQNYWQSKNFQLVRGLY